jgi:hypothetical protein
MAKAEPIGSGGSRIAYHEPEVCVTAFSKCISIDNSTKSVNPASSVSGYGGDMLLIQGERGRQDVFCFARRENDLGGEFLFPISRDEINGNSANAMSPCTTAS